MGKSSKAHSPMVMVLQLCLLGMQLPFWLVALGGVAQLMYNCREDTFLNPQDAPYVLGFGTSLSVSFKYCSAQYSWYFWVIFFHLITLGIALVATITPPGSLVRQVTSAVSIRFFLISTVQWCLFAYDANFHNQTYERDPTSIKVNDFSGDLWTRGYSAALAGSVVILITSFLYLIVGDMPALHKAAEAHRAKDATAATGADPATTTITATTGVYSSPSAPGTAPSVPAYLDGHAYTYNTYPGPQGPYAPDVEAGTAQKGPPPRANTMQKFISNVGAMFRPAAGATTAELPVAEAPAVDLQMVGQPGPPGPDDKEFGDSINSTAQVLGWGNASQSYYGSTHRPYGTPANPAYPQPPMTEQPSGAIEGHPSDPATDSAMSEERLGMAVAFLRHPKIHTVYTEAEKRKFLLESNRGMSPEEVEEAIRRAR